MTARWRALPATTQDVVLALLLGAAWFGCSWFWQERGWSPRNADVHVLAGAASVAALAVRRSAPAVVLALAVLAYPVAYDVALQTEFHLLPILVVAYVAGRHDAEPGALVAVACLAAGFLLSSGVLHDGTLQGARFPRDWSGILFDTFAVGSLLLLGAVTAAHRRTAATLTTRNAELEALRRVEAERAVAGERTRIARELHDDVAHHLTALIVRAQAAERVAATRPEVAVESVGWIAETARHALTSVRQTVSVLHADAPATASAPAPALRPGPSLADLPALVARVEDAGLQVALVVDERLPALDARAHHAAVRIVQESLTNVLRHACAHRVAVSVVPAPGAVTVTVEDDGTAGRVPADARLGHGVLGMQERARSCGGRLAVDVGELGGWRVRAWIPALDPAPG